MALAIYLRAMISIQRRFTMMRMENELLTLALKESERENRIIMGVIEACREVSNEIDKAGRLEDIERYMPRVYRATKKYLNLLNQAPYRYFLQGTAKRRSLGERTSYQKHHGIHECNGQG